MTRLVGGALTAHDSCRVACLAPCAGCAATPREVIINAASPRQQNPKPLNDGANVTTLLWLQAEASRQAALAASQAAAGRAGVIQTKKDIAAVRRELEASEDGMRCVCGRACRCVAGGVGSPTITAASWSEAACRLIVACSHRIARHTVCLKH